MTFMVACKQTTLKNICSGSHVKTPLKVMIIKLIEVVVKKAFPKVQFSRLLGVVFKIFAKSSDQNLIGTFIKNSHKPKTPPNA